MIRISTLGHHGAWETEFTLPLIQLEIWMKSMKRQFSDVEQEAARDGVGGEMGTEEAEGTIAQADCPAGECSQKYNDLKQMFNY